MTGSFVCRGCLRPRRSRLNKGSAPLFLERSRGVFLHAGPGEAAVCRVKGCPVRGCGQSAQIVDGANVDDRLSGRTTRHDAGSGTVFIHVLPPSVERSMAVELTTRHRLSGFEAEIDSLVARDSLSDRSRVPPPSRQASPMRRPETAIGAGGAGGGSGGAEGAAGWPVAPSPGSHEDCRRLVGEAGVQLSLAVLRSGLLFAVPELEPAAALGSRRYRHPHGRRSPATLPQAQQQATWQDDSERPPRWRSPWRQLSSARASGTGAPGVQAWRSSDRREPCAPSPREQPCTARSSTRALRPRSRPAPSACHRPRPRASRRRDRRRATLRTSAAVCCPASRCDPVRGPLGLSSY